MTLKRIPLDALRPHPENSNRMPPRLLAKLKGHIQRTGRYEPLVVRPLLVRNAECGMRNERRKGKNSGAGARSCTPHSALATPHCCYQILNGHHRARVLRELGHTHARCDVWEVDDAEARLLVATLNRLEGRDDPSARAILVAHLAEGRSPEALARLLPEPADAIERLLHLAQPPPALLPPEEAEPTERPMTFFLTPNQYAVVTEALGEVGRGPCGDGAASTEAPGRLPRAEAIERIALWYLEARGLR